MPPTVPGGIKVAIHHFTFLYSHDPVRGRLWRNPFHGTMEMRQLGYVPFWDSTVPILRFATMPVCPHADNPCSHADDADADDARADADNAGSNAFRPDGIGADAERSDGTGAFARLPIVFQNGSDARAIRPDLISLGSTSRARPRRRTLLEMMDRLSLFR
jgi:hypothetical protein